MRGARLARREGWRPAGVEGGSCPSCCCYCRRCCCCCLAVVARGRDFGGGGDKGSWAEGRSPDASPHPSAAASAEPSVATRPSSVDEPLRSQPPCEARPRTFRCRPGSCSCSCPRPARLPACLPGSPREPAASTSPCVTGRPLLTGAATVRCPPGAAPTGPERGGRTRSAVDPVGRTEPPCTQGHARRLPSSPLPPQAPTGQ